MYVYARLANFTAKARFEFLKVTEFCINEFQ